MIKRLETLHGTCYIDRSIKEGLHASKIILPLMHLELYWTGSPVLDIEKLKKTEATEAAEGW